jgi:hypothetical protein
MNVLDGDRRTTLRVVKVWDGHGSKSAVRVAELEFGRIGGPQVKMRRRSADLEAARPVDVRKGWIADIEYAPSIFAAGASTKTVQVVRRR